MRSLTCMVLAAGLAAGPLSAQDSTATNPNLRQGFWIGFGLGGGSIGVECDICSNDRTGGFSGNLKLGGTLSQSFLLGGETNGWLHSETGLDEQMAFASIVGVWYPSKTGPFYLKIGLGGMSYVADDGANELKATAPSGSFGLGYDFRVTSNMSVTLWLNSLASSPVDLEFNGVKISTDNITLNLVQIGAGLTWH